MCNPVSGKSIMLDKRRSEREQDGCPLSKTSPSHGSRCRRKDGVEFRETKLSDQNDSSPVRNSVYFLYFRLRYIMNDTKVFIFHKSSSN